MESSSQQYQLSCEGRDFRNLLWHHYKLGLFTDCTVVGSCGLSLNVHRVVLSSASEYLAKIFILRNCDVKPILVFPSLDFNGLKKVIEYIYTGELTISEDDLDDFMVAADTLRIQNISMGLPINQPEISTGGNVLADPAEASFSSSLEEDSPLQEISQNGLQTSANPPKAAKPKKIRIKKATTNLKQRKVKLTNSEGNIENLHCDFCFKLHKAWRNKREHQKECKQNPNRKRLCCQFCNRTFTRKARLNSHLKDFHKPQVEKALKDFNGEQEMRRSEFPQTNDVPPNIRMDSLL